VNKSQQRFFIFSVEKFLFSKRGKKGEEFEPQGKINSLIKTFCQFFKKLKSEKKNSSKEFPKNNS